jgi:hypothetical protein
MIRLLSIFRRKPKNPFLADPVYRAAHDAERKAGYRSSRNRYAVAKTARLHAALARGVR